MAAVYIRAYRDIFWYTRGDLESYICNGGIDMNENIGEGSIATYTPQETLSFWLYHVNIFNFSSLSSRRRPLIASLQNNNTPSTETASAAHCVTLFIIVIWIAYHTLFGCGWWQNGCHCCWTGCVFHHQYTTTIIEQLNNNNNNIKTQLKLLCWCIMHSLHMILLWFSGLPILQYCHSFINNTTPYYTTL